MAKTVKGPDLLRELIFDFLSPDSLDRQDEHRASARAASVRFMVLGYSEQGVGSM